MVIAVLFLIGWLGSCCYAILRGGQPERLVGITFLVAFPATFVAHRLGWVSEGVDWGIAFVDTSMLVVIMCIATKAARAWPLLITSMQIFQVGSHFTQLANPEMGPLVYWINNVVWAYCQLPVLLLGTVRHVNRTRRDGNEPSWRTSSKAPPVT